MISVNRIIHVLSSLRTGGAEINVVRLCAGLARYGVEQTVVTLTPDVDDALAAQLTVPLVIAPASRHFPASARFLADVARSRNATVIHGTNFTTWTDCVAAATWALVGQEVPDGPRLRLVQCFQGPGTFQHLRWSQRMRVPFLRRRTTAFVAVSPDIRNRLEHAWRVPPERITVIPNLVDAQAYRPAIDHAAAQRALGLEGHLVVGMVGTLNAVKNHELLLHIFANLARRRPESVLLIVGDGPRRAELEALAATLDIAGRVRFIGAQADVRPFLMAMDVCVHTSSQEGSPLAVMEALSCGIATLAAPSPGCVDMHAACGVPLIVEGDDERHWVDELLNVVTDAGRRARLERAGREAMRGPYGMDRAVASYRRVLMPASLPVEPATAAPLEWR